MAIVIKAKRVVQGNGELGFRITALKGLGKQQLPEKYVNSEKEPVVIYHNWSLRHFELLNRGDLKMCYYVGDFLNEKEFILFRDFCREAGSHLMRCNRYLKSLKEKWKGEVEILI